MADEPTTPATPEGSDDASGLRRQLTDALNENKVLKGQLRTNAFRDAGFDPESGPGKALAKLYDGEADPEAIRTFAKDEFGFEPVTSEAGETTEPNPLEQPGWNAAKNQALSDGEASVTASQRSAIPPRDPSIKDRIKEAEAAGDVATATRLNLELMHQQTA